MLDKLKVCFEKFCEAFTACGLAMVGGDITVLSLYHAGVASKTGALTALAFFVASFIPWNHKYLPLFLTGVFVAIADILVHPTHYGSDFTEALVTGAIAMVIAYAYDRMRKKA